MNKEKSNNIQNEDIWYISAGSAAIPQTKTIDPTELFTFKRIDLVVKYLYAKEILESKKYGDNYYLTECYKDLYIRHILMRTMGKEPYDQFRKEESDKQNIDQYINEFKNLINSLENNGFDMSYSVPATTNGLLLNGAHRVAAAKALNKQIYVNMVEKGVAWDFDWFVKNGFNTEDRQRILKGFIDLNSSRCAIFVIWNPLFQFIGNVKAILNNYFDIVGDVELNFEDNYIAFTNALLEIYEPNIARSPSFNDTVIREKAKVLQANELSFKVIVVTNQEKNKNIPISDLSSNCKADLRELFNHYIPKEVFCTAHSSDGESECKYLASVLLSPNNIKHLKLRCTTTPGKNWLSRVRNLPEFLKTLKIYDAGDVCVIGSSVMTALGIQEDSDSDFVIDYKYRDRLGWGVIYLNDDYDIGVSDKLAKRKKNIHDNLLIHNSEYHFLVKGIKFANLEMIKDRKSGPHPRPKDVVHVRQIDLFEKMIGHVEQRKILLKRIENEKIRRQQLAQKNKSIDKPINKNIVYNNFAERILSFKNEIKNSKKRKVITILGIKFKLKIRPLKK